jgi:hypothetical protein
MEFEFLKIPTPCYYLFEMLAEPVVVAGMFLLLEIYFLDLKIVTICKKCTPHHILYVTGSAQQKQFDNTKNLSCGQKNERSH